MAEPLMIYKLIILYMLDAVDFPLTNTQIANFILEKDYTNYFTLQQTLNDLISSELVRTESTYNNTQYYITPSGKETIAFFHEKLSSAIKEDIQSYLQTNQIRLKNETAVTADYYKTTNHRYAVRCMLKEKEEPLIDLTITVSNKEQATAVCDNWRKQSDDIFAYLMDQLIQ
ncbi:MAG: DUF4364 family protein [Lachnospiraceae bacterium]